MQEIIDEFLTIIESFKILENEELDEGFKFKAIIKFKNLTRLDARDFQILNKRTYSFHWMKEDNTLIIRWDNAKHYPNMKTYPFHKHIEQVVWAVGE